MDKTIVVGSLGSIAKQSGKSLAETFLNADVVVIVDTSGSMAMRDSRLGQSRYTVACEELARLQNHLPGKIAVIAFSDMVLFCPSGVPTYFGGGTGMAGALRFAKVADVPGIRFILISDGQPDSEADTLAVAQTYKNRIDVVYCGPEEHPIGRDFLMRLAALTGGSSVTVDRAKELKAGVQALLSTG